MRPVGGIGAQCEGSLGELDLFAGVFGGGKQGIVPDGSGGPSPAETVFAGGARYAAAGNAQALSTLGPGAGEKLENNSTNVRAGHTPCRVYSTNWPTNRRTWEQSSAEGEERAEKKPYG